MFGYIIITKRQINICVILIGIFWLLAFVMWLTYLIICRICLYRAARIFIFMLNTSEMHIIRWWICVSWLNFCYVCFLPPINQSYVNHALLYITFVFVIVAVAK